MGWERGWGRGWGQRNGLGMGEPGWEPGNGTGSLTRCCAAPAGVPQLLEPGRCLPPMSCGCGAGAEPLSPVLCPRPHGERWPGNKRGSQRPGVRRQAKPVSVVCSRADFVPRNAGGEGGQLPAGPAQPGSPPRPPRPTSGSGVHVRVHRGRPHPAAALVPPGPHVLPVPLLLPLLPDPRAVCEYLPSPPASGSHTGPRSQLSFPPAGVLEAGPPAFPPHPPARARPCSPQQGLRLPKLLAEGCPPPPARSCAGLGSSGLLLHREGAQQGRGPEGSAQRQTMPLSSACIPATGFLRETQSPFTRICNFLGLPFKWGSC